MKHIISVMLVILMLCLSVFPSFATEEARENVIITGDINCDESVSTDDVKFILEYISGIRVFSDEELEQADVTRDGKISLKDAQLVLKIASGIDGTFPKEYTPWEVTKEPTCSSTGTAASYCVTDNILKIRTLPKTTDHDFVDGYCSLCGKPVIDPYIVYKSKTILFGSTAEQVAGVLGKPTEILSSPTAEGNAAYYVYADDYKNLGVAIFTKGLLTGFYTTDTSAIMTDTKTTTGINKWIRPQEYVHFGGDYETYYYKDNLGTHSAYAVLFTFGGQESIEFTPACNFESHEKLNFHATNALRAINGLEKLAYDSSVARVAKAHSTDMAAKNYFSHTNLEGLGPGERIENAGISWFVCAENIDAGYITAFDMSDGWYNSEGHRSNILYERLNKIGVGICYNSNSDYIYYGTQNFIYN